MSEPPQWIIVPNWNKFQRFSDNNPPWIKLYTELNSRDDWLTLTRAARGLLVTIWIEYARSSARLTTKTVLRLCDPGTRGVHLKPLIDAGFIQLSVSPEKRREEERREEKKAGSPSAKKPTDPKPVNMPAKDGARYIRRLIKNGTITEPHELDEELAHYHLAKNLEAELRSLVQPGG